MVCKSTKLYWWQIREKQNLDNENYSSGVQKKKKHPEQRMPCHELQIEEVNL